VVLYWNPKHLESGARFLFLLEERERNKRSLLHHLVLGDQTKQTESQDNQRIKKAREAGRARQSVTERGKGTSLERRIARVQIHRGFIKTSEARTDGTEHQHTSERQAGSERAQPKKRKG
jgi:hypothetical protein